MSEPTYTAEQIRAATIEEFGPDGTDIADVILQQLAALRAAAPAECEHTACSRSATLERREQTHGRLHDCCGKHGCRFAAAPSPTEAHRAAEDSGPIYSHRCCGAWENDPHRDFCQRPEHPDDGQRGGHSDG